MKVLNWFLKGFAMGAANVIPGVSGGTIAFITGIYERLINALRAFDLEALRLLFRGQLRQLARHIDFQFLLLLAAGILASVFTLAKSLAWVFEHYPVWLWSFFLGLILASVFYVGRQIRYWSPGAVFALIVGMALAASLVLFSPASENSGMAYLFLCGVVAICSMILPGLSGSFMLIIMGNYVLLLEAVANLKWALLVPVLAGVVVGLLAFARFLGWIFRHYHDLTTALLTGFVAGSLALLWPWKEARFLLGPEGEPVLRKGEKIISGYSYHWPGATSETFWAFGFVLAGMLLLVALERLGKRGPAGSKDSL